MRDNVIDFIDREAIEAQAREWLVRLDGDTPLSSAERETLQRWAAQSPAHRDELLRIAAFWSEADLLAELATPHRKPHARWGLGLTRIWQIACATPRVAIAATLVLVIAAALLAPRLSGPDIEASNGLYATSVGEQREQTLSDGSVVEINTDSEVQVAYSNNRRLLRLVRGEAHFKVAHDARRPFDVYAGTSLIRATGTAFSVHMQGSDVTVTVAEGSVALGTLPIQPKESEISAPAPLRVAVPMLRQLESGHIARLHENMADVRELDTEDMARALAWRDGLLVFTGEPLSQVIDEVSRYTSVRIEIADARLRTLPVGGRFKLGDVDAMLDALESSFGIRVVRLDKGHVQLLAAPEHI